MSSSDSEDDIFMQLLMGTCRGHPQDSSGSSSSMDTLLEKEELGRRKRVKIMKFVEDVATQYSEEEFKSHFRMSRRTVYELIDRFKQSKFMPKYSSGRENVTTEKSVLLSIWYLANRNSFREISDRFGVSLSTAHNCLKRVLDFLCSIKEEIIKWPSMERRNTIQQAFARNNGIEGAIGAIDGSHIEIVKPTENQDSYINRKGYASLLLQGVVDHEKRFIDVFCGEPGSLHDARLLRRSALYSKILNNPEFIGENFILGDSAYPNLHWIVTPFQDNGYLTENQRKFNKQLSAKRVVVENAFGLLKGRFRRLLDLGNIDLQLCSKIILSCCILHNLCLNDDSNDLKDIDENDKNQPVTESFHSNSLIGMKQQISRQLQIFNKMYSRQTVQT